MVTGLFCNSIFGVVMTTFLVMKVLSSVLQPARSIFRAEFLGTKSQSFLYIVQVNRVTEMQERFNPTIESIERQLLSERLGAKRGRF